MPEDRTNRRRNRILSWIINLAGLAILIVILYLGGVGAWLQIARADWLDVGIAFLLTLAWNLVAAYRWSLIASHVSPEAASCPLRYYFTYQMLGMLTGQVVPIAVGMLGARPVSLSLSWRVPFSRSALSVFLDKAFDVIQASLLVVPVAFYLAGWIGLPLALGLMLGLTALGLAIMGCGYRQTVGWLGRIGAGAARSLGRLPLLGGRLVQKLPQLVERLSAASLFPNSLAVRCLLLTEVLYLLLSVRLFYIAQALRLEVPWYLLAMGACVTQLALIFAITPGSLGFPEAGWAAVLGLAGVPPEGIYVFLIARRAFGVVANGIQTLMAFAWIRESPARLFRAVMTASRRPVQEPEATPEA